MNTEIFAYYFYINICSPKGRAGFATGLDDQFMTFNTLYIS